MYHPNPTSPFAQSREDEYKHNSYDYEKHAGFLPNVEDALLSAVLDAEETVPLTEDQVEEMLNRLEEEAERWR